MADVAGDAVVGTAQARDGTRGAHEAPPRVGEYSPPITRSTMTYSHRARRISTGAYVFWTWTEEDPTGAHSGYGDVTDVILLSVTVN